LNRILKEGLLDKFKIRIAFSGGGFRATFYSLGAFRRLVELGLWENVSRIDSVSGGSVTAGAIMLALSKEKFKDIEDFDKRVTKPLRRLGQSRFREVVTIPVFIFIGIVSAFYFMIVSYFSIPLIISLIVYPILLFYIRPTKFFSINFQTLLNLFFFKKKLMQELPLYPKWCANATCLNSGKRFRFNQKDFGGNKIGVTEDNDIKVSFAVACSAAFPPVFAPFKLNAGKRRFYSDWWKKDKTLNSDVPSQLFLSDGGVYDNLGSENILQEKENSVPFIIIDAGQYMSQWSPNLNPNWFENNSRIIATSLDQIISLRRRILYGVTKSEVEKNLGVMLILGQPIKTFNDKYENFGKLSDDITDKMPIYDIFPEEIDKMVADLRTDLDSFHDIEIDMLMWAGAIRMDIALKRYFRKYLSDNQFFDVPKKPVYDLTKIKNILMKGRKIKVPLGFLHWNIRG
jgi:predicted acylesterase/phospholipase RssA